MSAAKDSFSQIEELFAENAKGFLTYEKLVKLLVNKYLFWTMKKNGIN